MWKKNRGTSKKPWPKKKAFLGFVEEIIEKLEVIIIIMFLRVTIIIITEVATPRCHGNVTDLFRLTYSGRITSIFV